jgi:hypothetical protein
VAQSDDLTSDDSRREANTETTIVLRWAPRFSGYSAELVGVYVVTRLVLLLATYYGRTIANMGTIGNLLAGWRGQYYLDVATTGYPTHAALGQSPQVAFFPLYPMLVRVVSTLSPLSPLAAGVLVSWIAGGVFTVLVARIVSDAFDRAAGRRAGIMIALFPGSFVASLPYAEALAAMLVAWSLWSATRDRPVRAGVTGALATLTSPVTLPLIVVHAWRARRTHDRRFVGAALASALGFVVFMLYLWVHTGSLAAWYRTETVSFAHHFDLVSAITHLGDWPGVALTELASLGVLTAALYGSWRARVPTEWILYGSLVMASALFDSTTWASPRMLYNAFPLLMGLAVWARREGGRALTYSFAMLLPLVFLLYMTLGNTMAQP